MVRAFLRQYARHAVQYGYHRVHPAAGSHCGVGHLRELCRTKQPPHEHCFHAVGGYVGHPVLRLWLECGVHRRSSIGSAVVRTQLYKQG